MSNGKVIISHLIVGLSLFTRESSCILTVFHSPTIKY